MRLPIIVGHAAHGRAAVPFLELGKCPQHADHHEQCREATWPLWRCFIVGGGDDRSKRVQAARDIQQDFGFTIGVHNNIVCKEPCKQIQEELSCQVMNHFLA
jgi:hypothetical protein